MITVLKAPPFATVQDLGRFGHRASAVPPSGAMDGEALARANLAVGNEPGAAAIEWGIGAGTLELPASLDWAIAGGGVTARREGDILAIEEVRSGAWAYIAVRGGIDVPPVLGSRSTYLPGRFGGLEGRLLRTGDVLPVGAGRTGREQSGAGGNGELAAAQSGPAIQVVPGPDRTLLPDTAWERFLATEWSVSRSVSRAGYRLDGPLLELDVPEDLPSAPVCPGAVQLPPGGRPIVLMPDGPTVGGYSRIAVVISGALPRLAQRRPGEPVRFVPA
jgi:antagonist of KipI